MRIAIGQFNATVGAFDRNQTRGEELAHEAGARGAALLLLPAHAIAGTPAEDLRFSAEFRLRQEEAVARLARRTVGGPAILAGIGAGAEGGRAEAALWAEGAILRRIGGDAGGGALADGVLGGRELGGRRGIGGGPLGGVEVVEVEGVSLGIVLGDEPWDEAWPGRGAHDPFRDAVEAGAQVVVYLAAAPFLIGQDQRRERSLSQIARSVGVPIIFCNLVGGNDSLVFDGGSLVVRADGSLQAKAKRFEEDLLVVEIEVGEARGAGRLPQRGAGTISQEGAETLSQRGANSAGPLTEAELEELSEALTLGVRDYVRKSGFERVLIGVSGGLDSAVVAALAVRALGNANVFGVTMPSRYTAAISNEDAAALARNLGIRLDSIPIMSSVSAFKEMLAPVIDRDPTALTEENLQARSRGVILMALSGELGALLLTTGNKSELAVGYCTLYGDMAGGLAVLGDVPKTVVFQLARHLNRGGEVIPERTITRPPSAELREDQTDQDSLPPYEVLDRILHGYLVEGLSLGELVERGESEGTAREVLRLLLRSEFKRRQAAPVLQVGPRAFGIDWRIPIAKGL